MGTNPNPYLGDRDITDARWMPDDELANVPPGSYLITRDQAVKLRMLEAFSDRGLELVTYTCDPDDPAEDSCDEEVARGLDCHECGHSLNCPNCCSNDPEEAI